MVRTVPRPLLVVYKHRWPALAVCACVVAGAAFTLKKEAPLHVAEVKLKYAARATPGAPAPAVSAEEAADQPRIIASERVLELALQEMGLLKRGEDPNTVSHIVGRFRGSVGAERIAQSSLFLLSVKHVDPDRALRMAGAIGRAYRQEDHRMRRHNTLEVRKFLLDRIRFFEGKVQSGQRVLDLFAGNKLLEGRLDVLAREIIATEKEYGRLGELFHIKARAILARADSNSPEALDAARSQRTLVDEVGPVLGALGAASSDADERSAIVSLLKGKNAELERSPRRSTLAAWVGSWRRKLLVLQERGAGLLAPAVANRLSQVARIDDFLAAAARLEGGRARLSGLVATYWRRFHDQDRTLASGSPRSHPSDQQFYVHEQGVNARILSSFKQNLSRNSLDLAHIPAGVTILDEPRISRVERGPSLLRIMVFAALLGVALGVALAFGLEALDPTFGSAEEVIEATGAPVAGEIPTIETDSAHDAASVHLAAGTSSAFDAYRLLATGLERTRAGASPLALAVTSCIAQEGKSTTTANLGVAFARMGKETIILSCNLRRPTLEATFGLLRDRGMSEVLRGDRSVEQVVRPTSVDGLHLVTSGAPVRDSSSLLSRGWLVEALAWCSGRFEVVLCDSPPCLLVSDFLILASHLAGGLLVHAVGLTGRRTLRRGVELFRRNGVDLLGIVLNEKSRSVSSYRYGYGYYGYGARDEPVP